MNGGRKKDCDYGFIFGWVPRGKGESESLRKQGVDRKADGLPKERAQCIGESASVRGLTFRALPLRPFQTSTTDIRIYAFAAGRRDLHRPDRRSERTIVRLKFGAPHLQQAERVGGGSRDQHLARSTRPRSRVYEVNAISHALEGTQDMAPLAKRPRRSDDVDASSGVYYDNVPGTSMTRASAGPASSIAAPQHPAYFPAHGPNGVSYTSMGAPVSPLLASEPGGRSLAPPTASSMPHGLSQMHSSGTEDNEDMAPPKSSSAQGTRGRGRGRGRARGRGRGRGTARAAVDHADVSQSYSDAHAFAPSTTMRCSKTTPSPSPSLGVPVSSVLPTFGRLVRIRGDDTELGYVVLSDVSDVVSQDTTFQTSTNQARTWAPPLRSALWRLQSHRRSHLPNHATALGRPARLRQPRCGRGHNIPPRVERHASAGRTTKPCEGGRRGRKHDSEWRQGVGAKDGAHARTHD